MPGFQAASSRGLIGIRKSSKIIWSANYGEALQKYCKRDRVALKTRLVLSYSWQVNFIVSTLDACGASHYTVKFGWLDT